MKKTIISLLVLALLVIGIHSRMQSKAEAEDRSQPQEQSLQPQQTVMGHLIFKGVPIDGPLDEFVANLEQVGFDKVSVKDGTATLKGDFGGYKSCTVTVSTLKTSNLVHAVEVISPERDNWSTLQSEYNELKALLTEKYGTPSGGLEEFQGNGTPRTDLDRWLKLQKNRFAWYTLYSTSTGDIRLSIVSRRYHCYVTVLYSDRANTAAGKARAKEDL